MLISFLLWIWYKPQCFLCIEVKQLERSNTAQLVLSAVSDFAPKLDSCDTIYLVVRYKVEPDKLLHQALHSWNPDHSVKSYSGALRDKHFGTILDRMRYGSLFLEARENYLCRVEVSIDPEFCSTSHKQKLRKYIVEVLRHMASLWNPTLN